MGQTANFNKCSSSRNFPVKWLLRIIIGVAGKPLKHWKNWIVTVRHRNIGGSLFTNGCKWPHSQRCPGENVFLTLHSVLTKALTTICSGWGFIFFYIPPSAVLLTLHTGLVHENRHMYLIACITSGKPLPNGTIIQPHNVIYQCSEDGVADTIKPRLEMKMKVFFPFARLAVIRFRMLSRTTSIPMGWSSFSWQ